jgi:hypothetical protein
MRERRGAAEDRPESDCADPPGRHYADQSQFLGRSIEKPAILFFLKLPIATYNSQRRRTAPTRVVCWSGFPSGRRERLIANRMGFMMDDMEAESIRCAMTLFTRD